MPDKASLKISIPALCLLLIFLCACRKPATDEELVREAVSRAAAAASAKDIPAVMRFVSKYYSDGYGNDYNAIRGVLFAELFKPGRVKVFMAGMDVEVKDARAVVDARAVLVRGSETEIKGIKEIKDIIPGQASIYRFSIVFRKEGAEWKALSADWKEAGVAGLL